MRTQLLITRELIKFSMPMSETSVWDPLNLSWKWACESSNWHFSSHYFMVSLIFSPHYLMVSLTFGPHCLMVPWLSVPTVLWFPALADLGGGQQDTSSVQILHLEEWSWYCAPSQTCSVWRTGGTDSHQWQWKSCQNWKKHSFSHVSVCANIWLISTGILRLQIQLLMERGQALLIWDCFRMQFLFHNYSAQSKSVCSFPYLLVLSSAVLLPLLSMMSLSLMPNLHSGMPLR